MILQTVEAALTTAGAVVLLVSLGGTRRLVAMLGGSNSRHWQFLRGLIAFLFASYLAMAALFVAGSDHTIQLFAGPLSLTGAVFVYLVVRLSRRTIGDLRDKSDALAAKEEALRATEAYHRKLVENQSDGVGVMMPDGTLTYVSPGLQRMLGLEPGDLVGKSIISRCHPTDLQVVLDHLTEMSIRPGVSVPSEARLLHADGSWRVLESLGRRCESGSFIVNVRDITERREIEDELRRLNGELEERVASRTAELTDTNRRLQKEIADRQEAQAFQDKLISVLENTTDFVGIADLNLVGIYANRAGRSWLGMHPDDDPSKVLFSDIFPPYAVEQIHREYMPRVMSEGVISYVVDARDHTGRIFPASVVGFLQRDADGQPAYVGGIVRDISELKRVEAELKAAKEASEAANRAKSTFLATMSHEIRTPMNAVIGMTGLLLKTPLDVKQRDYVETIRTSGDALLTLINDILDFAKIEAERLDLEQQPFDLRSSIESALDLLAPRAAAKKLDLSYLVGPEVPDGILGDTTRLRQILVNLVGNGIKFTPHGEVVVTVNSQVVRASGFESMERLRLHFTVRDTGIGFSPERADRLFQAFSQLDTSTTREYGGTGLGLVISRRLAEMMGGTMWAESNGPGQGALFHFTITTERAESPVRSLFGNQRPELRDKRILVVEDNANQRQVLLTHLRAWGLQADEAETATEAYGALAKGVRYDAALVDLEIPDVIGAILLGRMCAQQQDRSIPMIGLTTLGSDLEPEVEAIPCFAAYLTKPVKASQLYDVLVSALTGQSIRDVSRPVRGRDTHGQLATRLPMRILLAEDVAVNQKYALLALREMGYTADLSANGLEVLDALHRQPYDVVFMDVQMPEMDGLEATGRVRRDPSISPQPYIIAMTANAMQGDRDVCLAAGMDDYVSKPVYLEDLQAALERAGAARQRERQGGGGRQQAHQARLAASKVPQPEQPAEVSLADLYAAESQQLLARAKAAFAAADLSALRLASHSLKGSSLYVGAKRVAVISEALEHQARAGNLDGDVQALLDELDTALAAMAEQPHGDLVCAS
jgi:PAS domain S-box-containing protein